jgi:acetyl-CoA carboxylase biotin carboxyl carrier protein
MRVEVDGLKLHVSKRDAGSIGLGAAPSASAHVAPGTPTPSSLTTAAVASAGASAGAAAASDPTALAPGETLIKAPNLGVFWRQPKPGAPPYVADGDTIDADTTVCLIEVMKLFTPVKSGLAGRIVRCLAEDGQMVEHDTPLFVVQP